MHPMETTDMNRIKSYHPGQRLSWIILLLCLPITLSAKLTNLDRDGAIRVYIDGHRRFQDYVKTEIPFINYVRDRKVSQVHIIITSQRTGSGGREYTMTFIGQGKFAGLTDTLSYHTKSDDTEEIQRGSYVRVLKLGLIRYVAKTPLAKDIVVKYRGQSNPIAVQDRWNQWVFHLSMNGHFNGQESWSRLGFRGSFSGNRVTPDWKISLSVRAEYDESSYETSEGFITTYSRSQRFTGLVVKSLGEHWSMGMYGSARASIFNNIRFSANPSPAIEYNVFPYSESTRRELRMLYRIGLSSIRYIEETIFGQTEETLFNESLSATLEVKEKWGSIRGRLAGSNYFHDFNKNRIDFSCRLSLRLIEGISLSLNGGISMLRDQLSLSKSGASDEEILLQRKQLATDYNYWGNVGFTYSFGSIYSNVVNPRFGD